MGNFPARGIWMPHRISYGETDAMGVVYYANYLHLFERSRNAYIRERGLSYVEVEKRGIFLPVREAICRYRRPVRYDDLIYVRAGIEEMARASFIFAYEIYSEDKTVLHATGSTQHAVVDNSARPVPVPEWLRLAIQKTV